MPLPPSRPPRRVRPTFTDPSIKVKTGPIRTAADSPQPTRPKPHQQTAHGSPRRHGRDLRGPVTDIGDGGSTPLKEFDFIWNDGERVIRFGVGALAEAPELLAAAGFDDYALLTTERDAVQRTSELFSVDDSASALGTRPD